MEITVGTVLNEETVDYCFSIAKRINTFIKIRRSPRANRKSVPVHIVIDSLKNPYEFSFLKDRYSAYYTFAMLSQGEEEYDDSRFVKKKHTQLLETPNLIKNGFRKFLEITEEILAKNASSSNRRIEQYIQSLKSSDDFIQYLYDRLPDYDSLSNDLDSSTFLEGIAMEEGIQKFEQAGIMEAERSFYLEILKEPVRAFCMVSELFPFYLQDIQNATQSADVFLSYNMGDFPGLAYKVVRYVSLIMHPGLVPPTKEEHCMQVAFSAKVNSGCISRQVGAVVTDADYNILSLGWNDAHCDKISCIYRNLWDLQESRDEEVYSKLELSNTGIFRKHIKQYDFTDSNSREEVLDGLPPAYCFKTTYNNLMHGNNPDYSRAIHAEARAFWDCDKQLARGGCLFTTSSSCENCTMLANECGIKRIYYIEKYAGISQEHVNAVGKGEKRAEFILFEGATGNAYMKMYTPILPLKDELMLRGIQRLWKAHKN